MPLENATHISDLVPDWPQGPSDPVSIGDDNLRMLKKVLQNDLPNINAPITGTPDKLNNLTDGLSWITGSGLAGADSYWRVGQPDDSPAALVVCATPTLEAIKSTNAIMMNFEAIKDIFYPVGCKYENATDNRNPSQILGFGTWEPVVGLIAGVGAATDSAGLTANYSAGYQAGNWRVQNGHIVAQDLSVTLTMDAVDEHQHPIPGGTNDDANNNGFDTGTATGNAAPQQTAPAGGHTPTGTGSVTIGSDVATEGTAFVNPYYGMYIWVRTA
ncbi:hypothetical protein HAX39_18125 [Citrobacter freundii]|nr:hypothetical protein [Citrobacter freundii]